MGAWIETLCLLKVSKLTNVAPYVGAWIETTVLFCINLIYKSHPTWVRGLKLAWPYYPEQGQPVAPYVGAWIETQRLPC